MFERVRFGGSCVPVGKQPQSQIIGELARDKKAVGGCRLVTVHFLDDSQHAFPIDVSNSRESVRNKELIP